ncbi:tyrosine-type recombinase/integrase [Paraferrimonas sedimenticola]|uniref:Phage-related integrase n=1 Tax=Paraferrimonas sedimenticola TaxID=375674 RepID=A0AA37RTH9_9GAMM|nr:site-specific integrase [Paraferrimonas sedimenticola]GLP95341.1 phage-related integrase [Paraferrimonas sedimenticola]
MATGSRHTRTPLGDGVYKRITTTGAVAYELRYTINGRRRFYTLNATTKTLAKEEAATIKKRIRTEGFDPVAEKKRLDRSELKTVNDLFVVWQQDNEKRLEHPHIPARYYNDKMKPYIGELAIGKVTPLDIKRIIEKEANRGKLTSANKTLIHAKQLFNTAIKLGLITANPAAAFKTSDAGGKETPGERALSFDEVAHAFGVFREHRDRFTRDNYLFVAITLCLGIRKSELVKAQWSEFDLKDGCWYIDASRTKTRKGICVPLPKPVIAWLEELKIRACGSDYVLPPRRKSKSPHVSQDTVNHAVAKLFGKKVDGNKKPLPNVMGDLEYFHIHDLRRTCRTLLSELKVDSRTAEMCLNHKIKGTEGIYDRYTAFDERLSALTKLAERIAPIVNNTSNVLELKHGQRRLD